jgi:DMSO/TMAO reductase YedYZ molybdopterin-dependent catalytic subunit
MASTIGRSYLAGRAATKGGEQPKPPLGVDMVSAHAYPTSSTDMLPPGQVPRADFPRFGLTQYAERFPPRPRDPSLSVAVLGADPFVISDALAGLPRSTHPADFHCVTTWSRLGVRWGGVRFADFYQEHVAPRLHGSPSIVGVVLRGQDGYRTTMLLEDLLAADVLLADELDGLPLPIEHGAPLRLVAPQHYGYKSLKHLATLEFCASVPVVKHGMLAFLDHPRARVGLEERGRWFPGWFLRRLYRPFIASTAERFRLAMVAYHGGGGGPS